MPSTPTIAMIPSGYKEGIVFSVLPVNGAGDLDFERDSEATRINPLGVVETMADNVPRLDYENFLCPALLLEPERTNFIKNSEGTIIKNTPIGDFGFYDNGISNDTTIQAGFIAIDFIIKKVDGSEPVEGVDYTVSLGSNNITGALIPLGNGFFIFKKIYNLQSSVSSFDIVSDAFIGRVQLEQGNYHTTYIKTEGTVKTRLKDESFKGDLQNYINSNEGVIYFEGNALVNGVDGVISLSDGTSSNSVSLSFDSTDSSISFLMNNSVVNTTIFNQKAKLKIALMFEPNNLRAFINGNFIGFDSSANAVEDMNSLKFSAFDGSKDFYGRVENLSIYNEKMTDSELIKLTISEIITERTVYFGSVAVKPTTSSEVLELTELTNPIDNKFILDTDTTNTIFCFWIPQGVLLSSVIDF